MDKKQFEDILEMYHKAIISVIHKMGIKSLPMTYPDDQIKSKNMAAIQNELQIQISLKDFVRLLEQAKLQRSQITLDEVSQLITKL